MPKAEVNSTWWKKNKAKTLFDSGDSVLEALKAWDKYKKSGFNPKIYDILAELDKACKKLLAAKTTNKVLHKETIGYLEYYCDFAKAITLKLKNTEKTETELYKLLIQNKVPKSILAQFSKAGPWSEAWKRHGLIIEGLKHVKARNVPNEFFLDCANNTPRIDTSAFSQSDSSDLVDPEKILLLARHLMKLLSDNANAAREDCAIMERHLILDEAKNL